MNNSKKLCQILGIRFPIIQAGMVWVSGGKLAAASANAGILGLIGAGSMSPELLRQHIQKAKTLTQRPFGVNVPLLYSKVEQQLETALSEGVRIFFTSAGSPKKYTSWLKSQGCIVAHVTSSVVLAKKCQEANVDLIVAEGFEAGGHNGRDETTTMVLTPQVVNAVSLPVIAAGGIACGKAMAASLCLGASGVQIGTRFVCSKESSAHINFKQAIQESQLGDTVLTLKELVPVRLLKNHFTQQIENVYNHYDEPEELKKNLSLLLGKGRAKSGMLDGDLKEGELEIGQVASMIKNSPSAQEIIDSILVEFRSVQDTISKLTF